MTIYNAFWVLITNDRIFHNLLMLTCRQRGQELLLCNMETFPGEWIISYFAGG